MPKKIYPEGTIRVSPKGHEFIKVNGKWEYIKKPKEKWKNNSKKHSNEKIEKIRNLFLNGKSYEEISKITKCSKSSVIKYCIDLQINYFPIKIPKNMKETQYPGYYITEDGKAYRKPGKYDRNCQYGKINEYGLIYLNPGYGGSRRHMKYQYECINISIRDKNGKYLKQIKKYIHQLVAEAFVENLEGYTEVDHIDGNNKNNHYKNLRWVSREQNMENARICRRYFKIIDTIDNKVYEGENLHKFIRENWNWISKRTKMTDIRKYTRNLLGKYKKQSHVNGLILER